MLLISSRKDFWSCTEVSDVDAIRDCVMENPNPSVDVPVSSDTLQERIRGKRVLLLVHGYNNDEDDVNRAYALIERKVAERLAGHYDVVVGYTWPGGNLGVSYFQAKHRAKACAPRMLRWLQTLLGAASSVDINCHSMGNLVVLRALQDLAAGANALRIRHIWSLAAAVDNESLQKGENYDAGSRLCTSVHVFHTKEDAVLNISYRAAEMDAALGYSGPENPASIIENSPHVRVINCRHRIHKHGGYKACDAFYDHLAKVLTGAPLAQYITL